MYYPTNVPLDFEREHPPVLSEYDAILEQIADAADAALEQCQFEDAMAASLKVAS